MSIFGYRRYKNEEARFDAMIQDTVLRSAGVIEDDEPSEYSHFAYMQQFEREVTGDFTPEERHAIRVHLGLGPYATTDDAQASSPSSAGPLLAPRNEETPETEQRLGGNGVARSAGES